MKIATIVPTKTLNLVENDDYHLCLIQQLQRDKAYREFYQRMVDEGKYVILDNGAAEQHSSTIEELHEMAVEMGVSELQLPDIFFDGCKTLAAVEYSVNYLHKQGYKGSVMAVPQGRELRKWLACALEISFLPVDTIGIPKNLVHTEGPMGRLKAINGLRHLFRAAKKTFIDIHLLGCWTDPREIGIIKQNYSIRGVDSGIATLYTQEGLLLDPSKNDKPPKSVNFDDDNIDVELLMRNIELWKEACEHGTLRQLRVQ